MPKGLDCRALLCEKGFRSQSASGLQPKARPPRKAYADFIFWEEAFLHNLQLLLQGSELEARKVSCVGSSETLIEASSPGPRAELLLKASSHPMRSLGSGTAKTLNPNPYIKFLKTLNLKPYIKFLKTLNRKLYWGALGHHQVGAGRGGKLSST